MCTRRTAAAAAAVVESLCERCIPVFLSPIRSSRRSTGFVGACVMLSIHEFVRRDDAVLCVWCSSGGSVAAVARLPMSGALELHADLGRCLPGSHVHYSKCPGVFIACSWIRQVSSKSCHFRRTLSLDLHAPSQTVASHSMGWKLIYVLCCTAAFLGVFVCVSG